MIPGCDVGILESLQNVCLGPGCLVLILDAVQLGCLGSQIFRNHKVGGRAAVFGIAVGHKIVIAHPGSIGAFAMRSGNEIPDGLIRPGNELLTFDRAEFDGVALVHFFVDVVIVVVPGRYC